MFVPNSFSDGVAGGTPITAATLNNLENGLVAADITNPASAAAVALASTYGVRALLSGQYPMRALAKKIAAQNVGAAQVKWLTFGDSYAQKIWKQTSGLANRAFGGFAGAILIGNLGVTANTTVGTVTNNATDFANWVTGLTETYSAGSSRLYGIGGAGFVCDTIKVYWINAGGSFKIQVDGVDNTTPTVTSDNSLGVATIAVTRAIHTVTIVQLSGTPIIVGPGMIDSTSGGYVIINVSQGGIGLDSPTAQAWTNFQTFLTDINPDVMTFEMKEASTYSGGATYAQKLVTLFGVTAAGAPNMDVIGVGSPPVVTGDADQVAQNSTLLAACQSAGYMFWDSYTIFGSYARLVALGFQGDGVHVSDAGDLYRGTLMLRDIGVLNALAGHPSPMDVNANISLAVSELSMGKNPLQRVIRWLADTATDFDVTARLQRILYWADTTGTVFASFDARNNAGNPSALPMYSQFGPGQAGISSNGTSRVEARRWSSGNMNNNAEFVARTYIAQTYGANISGAATVDLSNGGMQFLTLTGNVTSLAFAGGVAGGQQFTVMFIQDATGSRTLTGVGSIYRWAGGVAPTLSTTPGRRDIFNFAMDNGGVVYELSRAMNVG